MLQERGTRACFLQACRSCRGPRRRVRRQPRPRGRWLLSFRKEWGLGIGVPVSTPCQRGRLIHLPVFLMALLDAVYRHREPGADAGSLPINGSSWPRSAGVRWPKPIVNIAQLPRQTETSLYWLLKKTKPGFALRAGGTVFNLQGTTWALSVQAQPTMPSPLH